MLIKHLVFYTILFFHFIFIDEFVKLNSGLVFIHLLFYMFELFLLIIIFRKESIVIRSSAFVSYLSLAIRDIFLKIGLSEEQLLSIILLKVASVFFIIVYLFFLIDGLKKNRSKNNTFDSSVGSDES